jgi:hypothetical protein
MSKAEPKLAMSSGLPEDLEILLQCHLYLMFPDEYNSDHFASKLANCIVRTMKPRKLTPAEQGAMVNHYARSRQSIAKAAETVADILGSSYSVEALKQNENRHCTLRSKELRAIRFASEEQIKHLEAMMSDADRESLKRLGDCLSETLKRIAPRLSRFRAARNDIIARSVIEDD